MQDECFDDLVTVGHVRDHVSHVVLRRADESGPKHQSQVPRLHLHQEEGMEKDRRGKKKQKRERE